MTFTQYGKRREQRFRFPSGQSLFLEMLKDLLLNESLLGLSLSKLTKGRSSQSCKSFVLISLLLIQSITTAKL